MACLFTHRRWQDPKTRRFMDFMVERISAAIKATEAVRPGGTQKV
jgi:hypothetical protein